MPLTLVSLCEIRIERGEMHPLGDTGFGHRVVAEVEDIVVTGERLSGRLTGSAAADWPVVSADGVTHIDARFTIRTHDGANVLVSYGGRAVLGALRELRTYVAPTFATGHASYRWLNAVQAVGLGTVDPADEKVVTYEVFELR